MINNGNHKDILNFIFNELRKNDEEETDYNNIPTYIVITEFAFFPFIIIFCYGEINSEIYCIRTTHFNQEDILERQDVLNLFSDIDPEKKRKNY